MNTSKKSILFAIAMSGSSVLFAQTNLGLNTVTKATAGITTNTSAVTKASSAVVSSTTKVASVAASKTAVVKNQVEAGLKTTTGSAMATSNETLSGVRKSASVQGTVSNEQTISGSGTSNGSKEVMVDANNSSKADVEIMVDKKPLTDKAAATIKESSAATKQTVASMIGKGKEIKAASTTTINGTSNTIVNTKPVVSTEASGEVKSTANGSVSNK